MTSKEAICLTLIGDAGWAVTFNKSQESGREWWSASHPSVEIPIVAMSVESLWEMWLEHPTTISHILGVRILIHNQSEKEKGNAIQE